METDPRTETRLSVTSVESFTFVSADYPRGAVQPRCTLFSLFYILSLPEAEGFISIVKHSCQTQGSSKTGVHTLHTHKYTEERGEAAVEERDAALLLS